MPLKSFSFAALPGLALCLSLAACAPQPTAQVIPAAALSPAARPAVAGGERLRLNLPRALRGKAEGFRTQALGDDLAYLRISVDGPGIGEPIESSAGEIDLAAGLPATVTIENVPLGRNRVIVAQFYDSDHLPLAYAAPMAVYSSGDDSANLAIRRQYSLLGRLLIELTEADPGLAGDLDAEALQSQLDTALYGANPVGGSVFAADPASFDAAQLAGEILAQAGDFSGIDFQNASWRSQNSGLSLTVSGLAPGETLTVDVADPLKNAVSSGNGLVSIANIQPGSWDLELSCTCSAPPDVRLAGVALDFSLQADGSYATSLTGQDFTAGSPLALGNLKLGAQPLSLDALSRSAIRSGMILSLTGANFKAPGGENSVSFVKGGDSTPVTAFSSADDTQISFTVPPLPEPGVYEILVDGQSAGSLLANVWMVSPDGNGQGFDWDEASSLPNALAQAAAGEQIWLEAGTYRPDASDRHASFIVGDGLELLGGFDGVATDGSRDPQANPVTLSGDLAGNDAAGAVPDRYDFQRSDNAYHVVTVTGSSRLDGLTISGGHAFNQGSPPASSHGGGLLVSGTGLSVSLQDLILRENYADGRGGGLYADGSTISFADGLLVHNGAGSGGGMHLGNAGASLSDSRFLGNQSRLEGGGLAIRNACCAPQPDVSATRMVFAGNQSPDSGGGALYLINSSPVFENAVFADNSARSGGVLTAYNNENAPYETAPVFRHTTFSNNTAAVTGPGFFLVELATVVFENSLIWNETPTSHFAMLSVPNPITLRNSLVQDLAGLSLSPSSSGNNDADPLFADAADADGDDDIWLTDDDGVRITIDSAATDMGAELGIDEDVLGHGRDGAPDAGAYEIEPW